MAANQQIIHKRIDNLLAIGQQLLKEATELRSGSAVKSGTARKGLSVEQKQKLIGRRLKTAFKPNTNA